jgi:hypothetical protein
MQTLKQILDEGQANFLLSGDLEVQHDDSDRQEYFFEDDGTLFYTADHIQIYQYFGQENNISEKQKARFRINAKEAIEEIKKHLDTLSDFEDYKKEKKETQKFKPGDRVYDKDGIESIVYAIYNN